MTREIKILSPTGILGYGFPETSLRNALAQGLDFIGVDAGSTDPGPYYLGAGVSFTSRRAVKRDLRLLLRGARQADIPLIVGSAGGAGGTPHLNWTREILEEASKEHGLHFKLALIGAEQDKRLLKNKLKKGKIKPLGPIEDLTPEIIDRSERIVAMMGAEPLIRALEEGADVIVAGRSSDAAVFAAYPLRMGFNHGLAWHMAKIIECASYVVEPKIGEDGVIGTLGQKHFLVEPADPAKRCPRIRVAAHTLYENPDPYHLYEPSGMLDTTCCVYEQHDEKTVKVSGSTFLKADRYTVKLEGVERAGWRHIFIGGIRDPILIGQIDSYLEMMKEKVMLEAEDMDIRPEEFSIHFRLYGKNGVMGPMEPLKENKSHELGLIIDVIGATEEISAAIIAKARNFTLHSDFPGRLCVAGNLAIPFSPSDIALGPSYKFTVWHVLELDDPLEVFPMEIVTV